MIDALLLFKRSEEESSMLITEANNVVEYYQNLKSAASCYECDAELNPQYTRGVHSLLHHFMENVNSHLEESEKVVLIMNEHVDMPVDFDSSDEELISDDDLDNETLFL